MNLLKNFHKSITFFLSLYLICQIFSTDFCLAGNIAERKNSLSVGMIPLWDSVTDIHTKNESLLFAFGQKNFFANIQKILFIQKRFFVWLLLPFVVVVALAGYFSGKRKGMKTALEKEYPANIPPPVVLNENEKYEDMAAREKPFIKKYDMVTVLFADIEGFSDRTDKLDPETLLD